MAMTKGEQETRSAYLKSADVKVIPIQMRHAEISVGEHERDSITVETAQVTLKGEVQIAQKTPYFIEKFRSEPDRDHIVVVQWNNNRDRTAQTADSLVKNLRATIKGEGLKNVRIIRGGHADVLDTTEPLKKRILKGDTKGDAHRNWVTENEDDQRNEGIEPPSDVYKKIVEAENSTIRKVTTRPERVKIPYNVRPEKPRLFRRPTIVYPVGITHENYHGAILKSNGQTDDALRIGYTEPIETHVLPNNEGVIYKLPDRKKVLPVRRKMKEN